MTVLKNMLADQNHGAAVAHCPDPVSLETIELIQQALVQALRSLRRGDAVPAAEPGRLEYESWLPRRH